jgi:CheY-like chemotaxis protein
MTSDKITCRASLVKKIMQRSVSTNQLKNEPTGTPWLIYVLIIVTATIIIGMMGYSYTTSTRMNTVYAPLVDATMEIKLSTTTGHLWFEEIMSGDSHEDIEIVWDALDEADWYAQVMLEGGENTEGTFISLDDISMRNEIKHVQEKLVEFRRVTQQRLDAKSESGVGSDIDQRYDAIFADFIEQADQVETRLQEIIAQDLSTYQLIQTIMLVGVVIAFVATGGAFHMFNRRQQEAEIAQGAILERAVDGIQVLSAGDYSVEFVPDDENDQLGLALQKVTYSLRHATTESKNQVWQSNGQAQLSDRMRGEQNIVDLAGNIIQFLCEYTDTQVGALYLNQDDVFRLVGTYAYVRRKNLANQFKIGEGLVGQAALEKKPIALSEVPDDYIRVTSGLGESVPRHIVALPFIYEGQVLGVIELAMLTDFTDTQLEFMSRAVENIAIAFNTAYARQRMQELLQESQQKSEELQTQEEELRVTNEELISQTETLQESEKKLKKQQQELEMTNVQLEEQAAELEQSRNALQEKQDAVDKQNRELKVAQTELERKAEELTLTSKYKSEFLANMSHELRTPLNSLLILARILADNKEGNLTDEQVESAKIILNGGNDLLTLINEVLDLSKIEAGKMEFHVESIILTEFADSMRWQFNHVAQEKGIAFEFSMAEELPEKIETDKKRVEQIIKNLLSNAFKFTEKGKVSLTVQRPPLGVDLSQANLNPAESVAICVTDTGIGMTPEQQKIIFEAFQQADGSTSRKYGGTGLGLSISRELVSRLGGHIAVRSKVGEGSTFTLYLPERFNHALLDAESSEVSDTSKLNPPVRKPPKSSEVSKTSELNLSIDDRNELQQKDTVLLIVEDDANFAKVLSDVAHKKGLKCLIANDGRAGLKLALKYKPAAIILDLNLPDITGWNVLTALKDEPETRHIPVHIMSVEDETIDAFKQGAIGYLTKPVSPEDLDRVFQRFEGFTSKSVKKLLLIEDDTTLRYSVKKLLGSEDIEITEAGLGQTALDLLREQRFDCMILDLKLPDMTGFELLSIVHDDETIFRCPVIVYTGQALSKEENEILMKYTDSVVIKGVKSPERLLDETALFLHQVVADMPDDKQRTIRQLYDKDMLLAGKKILLVDDDVRNSFALSKLLTDKGVIVEMAENGQDALAVLEANRDMDLVLMDIMMPVMDGYETTKRIRQDSKFKNLPILALTAKAMKGDKEKCIEAGANDYLSKPIDADRLFSMLRVWLY